MNATIKHGKRWIAKSLEVGPITGRPSGVCRHENGKPIGGKLAFNGTLDPTRPGVGPWLGLIASEISLLRPGKRSHRATGFADFFAQVYHCQCHIVHHMPVILGGWMAQWRAWIRMDGRIFVGTVGTCSPRTLRCPGSVFSYLTMENPSWYQPQGSKLES